MLATNDPRGPVEQYKVERNAMRHFLIGRNYFMALDAMEFALTYHTGTRKNGIDPEFSHQIFIANYLRTLLAGLLYPEETLAAAFLHDVCEDYDIPFEVIEQRFGPRVALAVRRLTKKFRGVSVPYETYFPELALDPIASIVKGADRAHNVFTMTAAGWTTVKQQAYLEEVTRWFLPMLKQARRQFARQEAAIHNVKTLLKVQQQLIGLHLNSLTAAPN